MKRLNIDKIKNPNEWIPWTEGRNVIWQILDLKRSVLKTLKYHNT